MSYFFALRNLLSLSVWHPLFSKASAKVLPFFLPAKYFHEKFSKICNFYASRFDFVDNYQKPSLFLVTYTSFCHLSGRDEILSIFLRLRPFGIKRMKGLTEAHVGIDWSDLWDCQKHICGYTEAFLWIQLVAEGSSSTCRAFGIAMAKVRRVNVEGSVIQ